MLKVQGAYSAEEQSYNTELNNMIVAHDKLVKMFSMDNMEALRILSQIQSLIVEMINLEV